MNQIDIAACLTPDMLNGLFELIGGVLLWGSVVRLWRDREIKGVWWPAWFFYFGWGLWNLIYYPSIRQWYSFAGGLVVVAANASWCCLALWLRSRRGKR